MRCSLKLSAFILLMGAGISNAFAQPAAQVSNHSVSQGTATPVAVTVDYVADGAVFAAQIEITYDSANLSVTVVDAVDCPSTLWSCTNNVAGTIVITGVDIGQAPLPSIQLGPFNFDASSAAVGTYPLTRSVENYSDGDPVAPVGSSGGEIDVTGQPTYSSTPVAGNAIDLGAVNQGGTDPEDTLDINNTGDVNTTLTGSCTLGGANPGTFSLTPDNSFSILQGSGPDTTTITCDSDQTVGVHNATLTCTHDGDNASPPSQSPVSYALICDIQAEPLPEYGSDPAIGSLIDLGVVTTLDSAPTAPVEITNTGAATTTLTGTCSITNNPGGVYSVADGAFDLGQSASEVQTVTCDNSTVGTFNGGVLSCSHNGATATNPATYTLNCEVQPVPAYDSTPAPGGTIDLGTTPQNNTPPTGGLDIENVGDPGSTLSGTCSLVDGTTPISISGSGDYSVLQGAVGLVSLTCDTANDQGDYSDTLSCTDNDPQSDDPHTYTVDCAIGPPDPAVYSSVPAAGATINLTPDGAVPQDTDLTDAASLSISNAANSGDDFLDLQGCAVTAGDTAIITANPVDMNADINVGDPAAVVSFSCDTTAAGNYSVTYTCPYDDNPSNVPPMETIQGVSASPATYTVQCDVRTAISEVTVAPASGTPLVTIGDPGGSAQLSVEFSEIADEGVNGSVDCSLADGTNFVIDTVLPADILAGDSLTVTVTGTDPGTDVTSISDTLNCTYTDSANTDPGVDVTYPLTIEFGGAAGFTVTKTFADDSDEDVTVTLTCNTGLPLQQSFDISPGDPVMFVVTSFESGLMDCVVTEGGADAYATTYIASGDSQSADDDPDAPGCHFFAVAGGDRNACDITNSVEPVDVVIEKEWVIDGAVSDEVNQYYQLTLYCDSMIIGGTPSDGNGIPMSAPQSFVPNHWYKEFDGMGNDTFTAKVVPDYPSTSCWVYEDVNTSGVEVDNGCMNIEVSAGNGASCKITNTVFFEGIPTLSQYGLALMALLMLGVGMVGFRRFA